MMGNEKLNLRMLALAAMVGLGASLAACDKKEESPMERASDSIQDGLNMRDNEEMKDAGEDVKSAVENTGDAIEKKADDVAN
jgi:hypothetical protein